jgi:hypothetical protein
MAVDCSLDDWTLRGKVKAMNEHWAAENLQTIRTLMERSAVYRRALAPVMMLTGGVGLAAGGVGWVAQCNSSRQFILFWFAVAIVALVGSFVVIRRQALREHEPFWSPPTRRVAQAMLPNLFIGLIPGLLLALFEADGDIAQGITWVLIPVWTALYGAALNAAGFFMPRGIRLFGSMFIVIGTILLLGFYFIGHPQVFRSIHLAMGGIFGGLHLAYGIYLHFTEPKNAS